MRGKYVGNILKFLPNSTKGLADIPCYISSGTIETRAKRCNNLKGIL
jgi:hypothetical protein